jgi:hypothetical protein
MRFARLLFGYLCAPISASSNLAIPSKPAQIGLPELHNLAVVRYELGCSLGLGYWYFAISQSFDMKSVLSVNTVSRPAQLP